MQRRRAVGIAEHRLCVHGLTFGVDRLAFAFWVLAPVGSETPAQGIERDLASLMIALDHQEVLAGSSIPSWRVVGDAAVARTSMPSTIARRIGALLWMTLPHMIASW